MAAHWSTRDLAGGHLRDGVRGVLGHLDEAAALFSSSRST